ncbi:MAG: response regulator transcription factor [Limnohabitans sp.]|jgi:two-component system OmpR family response regulator|uniref:response regulator transcription factor n=1 Tax=Limnohabitans sp. TaxID=1907725 RepID=UPI0011D8CC3A|nr:MAG: response regulator transcription factor [Limnohabitans sp.]
MKLLLAEDDALLADALSTQLRGAGFQVAHAPNGAVADYLLEREPQDIAVLDLGLPMLDGLSVLQKLRARQPELPVILLTARDSLNDRVAGLQAGADDYVTKPFDFPELLARLQALLRRSQRRQGMASQVGRLSLDEGARRAWVAGESIELSGREWTLLSLLVQQQGKVVTKEQIHAAWSDEAEVGGGNAIEVYVHRLRRKTDGAGVNIRTVRGIGYLLEAEAS